MTKSRKPRTAAQRADTGPNSPDPAGDADRPETAPVPPSTASGAKIDTVLAVLRQPGGVTIADISAATGWQPHTVRGALAGSVVRKTGSKVTSHKEPGEARRYRLPD